MAKIMMLSTVHQPKDIRIMQKEAISLSQAGHDVSFLVTSDKEEVYKGVKIIPIKPAKSRKIRMFLRPFAVIREVRKHRPDVIHAHDPELLPALMWLKLFGYTVVYDAHEDFPAQTRSKHFIAENKREFAAKWAERYINFCVKRMHYVFVATPTIKEKLEPHNKNISVVNNFPLLTEFGEPPEWSKRRKAIVYFGGGYEKRGFTELMEVLAISKLPLEFGGIVEPESYREKIVKTEGWQYVNDHGYVSSRKEVQRMMDECSLGIITYYPEPNHVLSQPIKFFEYMASAIPMVVSDFPYWRQLLDGCDCAFFVDPKNPQDIAEKLMWLVEHDEEARIMGERGRKAVLAIYNWEHEAKILCNAYENIILKIKKK